MLHRQSQWCSDYPQYFPMYSHAMKKLSNWNTWTGLKRNAIKWGFILYVRILAPEYWLQKEKHCVMLKTSLCMTSINLNCSLKKKCCVIHLFKIKWEKTAQKQNNACTCPCLLCLLMYMYNVLSEPPMLKNGWPRKQDRYLAKCYTHTQTCKHRQTESSHCSSFVYTLTFSQHLSYVLYTFGKRGPFSNWGPYCSFCYKSPVWMPKQTHTHTHSRTPTHTVHMALMGYFIVFSFVTKPGQTLEFLLWGTIVPLNFLAGYYCSIVASTQQPNNLRCTRSLHTHIHSTATINNNNNTNL